MRQGSDMLLKTLLREADNDSKMQSDFSKNVSSHSLEVSFPKRNACFLMYQFIEYVLSEKHYAKCFTYIILFNPQPNTTSRYHHFHVTDVDNKDNKGEVICPRPHRMYAAQPELKPRLA